MSAPITRTHRLAVARAWAGEDSLAPFVQGWVEDGHVVRDQFKPVIETLERLAQLVADAEGPLRQIQDHCRKVYGHAYAGGDKCADCHFPKPPEQP